MDKAEKPRARQHHKFGWCVWTDDHRGYGTSMDRAYQAWREAKDMRLPARWVGDEGGS